MANLFSGDSDCKALWSLESGALETDSIGSNTLTNHGVTADAVNYEEGSASGDFEYDSSQYLIITDANLDAGFPLKNGDTNKTISLAFWLKVESLVAGNYHYIFSKYNPTTTKRSFGVAVYQTTGNLTIFNGYNAGASYEEWSVATISPGTWYHVGIAHDGVSKTITVRIYNATTGVATTYTHTWSNETSIADAALALGARSDANAGNFYDGLLDEVVVFSRLLIPIEFDAIRSAFYGEGLADVTFEEPTCASVGVLAPYLNVSLAYLRIQAYNLASGDGLDQSLEEFTIEAEGTEASFGKVQVDLSQMEANIEGDTGTCGVNDVSFKKLSIEATGKTGLTGSVDVELLPPTILAGSAEWKVDVTLPYFQIFAGGDGIRGIDYVAVMNILNFAMSEYQNFNFNSYCYLGEIYLGADETGIHQLYGANDNGVPIDFEVEKTGMDFKSSQEKRVPEVNLGLYCDGDFSFEMITEQGSQVYLQNNGTHGGLASYKIDPGKGLTGRYLGFNIKNLKGSDIALTQVGMLIEVLSRMARG